MKVQNNNQQSFKAITAKGTAKQAKLLQRRLVELCPKQQFDKPFVSGKFPNLGEDVYVVATDPREVLLLKNSKNYINAEQQVLGKTEEEAIANYVASTGDILNHSSMPQDMSQILVDIEKSGANLSFNRVV